MSCEKLNAALAAIAEAREMLLDNSPLDFVPLGLQQLLSLLQGHEVCLHVVASLYSRAALSTLCRLDPFNLHTIL